MDPIAATWVLVCAILVCSMQIGFLWLECGLVRKKNVINVAIKNLSDFCISAILFWAFGFALMFGLSNGGVFGVSLQFFDSADPWAQAFFFFQLAFCGTAVTIVSGAVAERMSFPAYLLTAGVCAGLIYPLFGHWAWGSLLNGADSRGWLEAIGFIDFAGSTVVHSVGGWVALAAILVIGPRMGRYGKHRDSLAPSDLGMAISGAFLLWIGWFGFNGGSALAMTDAVPGVLLNTLIAPAAGACVIVFLSISLVKKMGVPDIINGVIAGLVGITANCHLVSVQEAILIGGAAALITYGGTLLLERLKIDDAVGAIPAHLFAGVWGTLAVALFGDSASMVNGSRWDQFVVQLAGVAACGALSFTTAYAVLFAVNRIRPLRVSRRQEFLGLNASEHRQTSPMDVLLGEMRRQAHTGDFSKPVRVERFTAAGAVALGYNRVLERFRRSERDKEAALSEVSQEQRRAEAASMAKSQFLSTISHEFRTPLNAIINLSRLLTLQAQSGPGGGGDDARRAEFLKHIENSGAHLLGLIDQILRFTALEADKYELKETDVDLRGLVHETCDYYRQRIADSGLTCSVTVEPGLPLLHADRDAVRQVLLNLLSNAIQHSPKGGAIAVSAYQTSDDWINLTVKDSGKGVAKDDLKAVLTPFTQVVKPGATPPDGMGLGLTLAQALVRAHGGSFFLRSEPGQGLEAFVRFPAARIVWPMTARLASHG